jgi:hypothetical protein
MGHLYTNLCPGMNIIMKYLALFHPIYTIILSSNLCIVHTEDAKIFSIVSWLFSQFLLFWLAKILFCSSSLHSHLSSLSPIIFTVPYTQILNPFLPPSCLPPFLPSFFSQYFGLLYALPQYSFHLFLSDSSN